MSILTEYSIDWQHIVVLIYALEHMSGDIPTRATTMDHIRNRGLLHLRPEDYVPYRSSSEPSWQTDMAWARKNAVMLGFINNHDWNSWELARPGREFLQPVLTRFRDGTLFVSRCFLFSHLFKSQLNLKYTPSSIDCIAPPKGERSMPNIEQYRIQLEELLLQKYTLQEIAYKLSRKLGITIPPTKPSCAFGLHLLVTTV